MAFRAKSVNYSASITSGNVVANVYTVPLGVTARIMSVQIATNYHLKVNNTTANTDGAITSASSIDFVAKPFYLGPGDSLSLFASATGSPSLLLNVIEEYERQNTDFEQFLGMVDTIEDMRKWDSTRTYALYDPVFHNGVLYRSLQASNLNRNPSTQPTWWASISGGTNTGDVQETIDADKTYSSLTTHHRVVCNNTANITVNIKAGAAQQGTLFVIVKRGSGTVRFEFGSSIYQMVGDHPVEVMWDGVAWRGISTPHGFVEYLGATNVNWVAPAGVTGVVLNGVGQGGNGAAGLTNTCGGGGGGSGAWCRNLRKTVVPGQSYNIVLSTSGNSAFFGVTLGRGGNGSGSTGGAGGTGSGGASNGGGGGPGQTVSLWLGGGGGGVGGTASGSLGSGGGTPGLLNSPGTGGLYPFTGDGGPASTSTEASARTGGPGAGGSAGNGVAGGPSLYGGGGAGGSGNGSSLAGGAGGPPFLRIDW